MLRKKCGAETEKRFWDIMINNYKQPNEIDLLVVQKCSEALLSYWATDLNSPVTLFQQAIANPI
jgi:hypothetical protein